MNLILVAIVSVILATGVFNTEPKVSEGNKKTEIIVKDSSEKIILAIFWIRINELFIWPSNLNSLIKSILISLSLLEENPGNKFCAYWITDLLFSLIYFLIYKPLVYSHLILNYRNLSHFVLFQYMD